MLCLKMHKNREIAGEYCQRNNNNKYILILVVTNTILIINGQDIAITVCQALSQALYVYELI